MSRIVIRQVAAHEQEQVLRTILVEPRAKPQEAQRIWQTTQAYLGRSGGTLAGLYVAESAGQMVTACAAIDLPGRVTLLMLPSWSLTGASAETLPDLLGRATEEAVSRPSRFAQILVEPGLADHVRPLLLAAGFEFLANLHYMQRNAFDPAAIQPPGGVSWRTLSDAGEQAFIDVIRRTYASSRDCPGLMGIRTMPEILAGHKAAGEFDPAGWYVLQHEGHDVGVLLTARTPLRPAIEIVYCGLAPEARGKGLGRTCVHKAILRARDLAIPTITLAVDAANDPARRTYEAMGFATYTSRDVWIKVFRRADAEQSDRP